MYVYCKYVCYVNEENYNVQRRIFTHCISLGVAKRNKELNITVEERPWLPNTSIIKTIYTKVARFPP